METKVINQRIAECKICGASGQTYNFIRKYIGDYKPNTTFIFGETDPVIYIFANDVEKEKPTLLDIEFNDNWKLKYKQLKHFKYLSQKDKKPTHMYYFKDFVPNVSVFIGIISDILDGRDFNIKDYDYPLPD